MSREIQIQIRHSSYKIDLSTGDVWQFVFEPKRGPDAGAIEGWEIVGKVTAGASNPLLRPAMKVLEEYNRLNQNISMDTLAELGKAIREEEVFHEDGNRPR